MSIYDEPMEFEQSYKGTYTYSGKDVDLVIDVIPEYRSGMHAEETVNSLLREEIQSIRYKNLNYDSIVEVPYDG